jgi:hypothetical protein
MPPPKRGHAQSEFEIPEPAYQALLKGVAKGSKVSAQLAAEYRARNGKAFYACTGSRPEGLLLRAPALTHAKGVVPALKYAWGK